MCDKLEYTFAHIDICRIYNKRPMRDVYHSDIILDLRVFQQIDWFRINQIHERLLGSIITCRAIIKCVICKCVF